MIRRGPLYHAHRSAGTTFAECHGWEVAARFGAADAEATAVRSSAGIADLSYRAKFETRAPAEGAWRLGAERYLVVGEPPVAAPADAFDISGVYASLLLAGPRSRDVLGKLTSLNTSEVSLANRNCAQASVAHVHAIVLREDIGALPAFHLLIARDYAESVWEAVLHAGEEFHLQPFGLDALRLLGA